MVVGKELSALSRQVVRHRYIFANEKFQMVCTHVFDEGELVEVVKEQGGDIFGAMQKDTRVAYALIDWANKMEKIQEEHGWND
jgi:hypothetical protein